MKRRRFLQQGAAMAIWGGASMAAARANAPIPGVRGESRRLLTLFLGGDVMTGRGIDQILRQPSRPRIHESYVRSALDYVALAERAHGPLPRHADPAYVWGDALRILGDIRPDVRIVNLETAVTTHDTPWPGKGIQYRMHPANVDCLVAAALDCCVLANNHVMDWSRAGLAETLATLRAAGLRTAGAGRDLDEAAAPATIPLGDKGRVLVFAYGMPGSGIPVDWAAGPDRSGVNLLRDLSSRDVDGIVDRVRAAHRQGDVVVVSLHWGGNWGYAVHDAERRFAQELVASGVVDVLHGHSSHHPKAIEVHDGKPICYGCGDLLDDYEGIGGHEAYRAELGLLYCPSLELGTRRLASFPLVATRIERFRINQAAPVDAAWLAALLTREGRPFGTRAELREDGRLALAWS